MISDAFEVCKIVGKESHQTRVHAFGFGRDVDKYLVKELAKQGKGTYKFINDDNSKDLNSSIIKAL